MSYKLNSTLKQGKAKPINYFIAMFPFLRLNEFLFCLRKIVFQQTEFKMYVLQQPCAQAEEKFRKYGRTRIDFAISKAGC